VLMDRNGVDGEEHVLGATLGALYGVIHKRARLRSREAVKLVGASKRERERERERKRAHPCIFLFQIVFSSASCKRLPQLPVVVPSSCSVRMRLSESGDAGSGPRSCPM